MRVVLLRSGVVLSRDGGILRKILPPFRLGLGGKIGSGAQWLPWIHLEDEIGLIRHAMAHEAVERARQRRSRPSRSPTASSSRTLGEVLGRPTVMKAPAFALRLAFGAMTDELLLASQRAMPVRTLETGYAFRHPLLREALGEILAKGPQRPAGDRRQLDLRREMRDSAKEAAPTAGAGGHRVPRGRADAGARGGARRAGGEVPRRARRPIGSRTPSSPT